MSDKYSATWVSHSSTSDFLTCPRAYYLNNVYKNSKTGRKITLMSPPLALGQTVHSVIESLSTIPVNKRFQEPLMERFNEAWKQVSGNKGGFTSDKEEERYKKRGADMIRRVLKSPGPLKNLAVKINQDLPHYWLSEEDNIILCGKIDWLEYLENEDAVHIIDFKTGKKEENKNSLQLPIYHLLVKNCQDRPLKKASYWYLEFSDTLQEVKLPDEKESHEKVLKIAKKIKLARALDKFSCPHGDNGCYACKPLEKVITGEAEHVGVNNFNQDIYIKIQESKNEEKSSKII